MSIYCVTCKHTKQSQYSRTNRYKGQEWKITERELVCINKDSNKFNQIVFSTNSKIMISCCKHFEFKE